MRHKPFFRSGDKHDGKFEPLRRVDRHQIDFTFAAVVFDVVAAQERNAVQIIEQTRIEIVGIVFPRFDRHEQRFDILQLKAHRFFVFLKFADDIVAVLYVVDEFAHFVCKPSSAEKLRPCAFDRIDKFSERFFCRIGKRACGIFLQIADRIPQRARILLCRFVYRRNRTPSDTSSRRIDDSKQIDVVALVRRDTQIAYDIFYFEPFEKTRTAAHRIGNVRLEQGFFDRAALRVCAHEYAEIVVCAPLFHRDALNAFGDKIRFGAFVFRHKQFDRLSRTVAAPQLFVFAVRVVRYDAVRRA